MSNPEGSRDSLWSAVGQIIVVDLVFSFDSVITAVGVADSTSIMIIALVTAIVIMVLFSRYIVEIIARYPTLKMLILSFILLVGVLLVMAGGGKHIERGYIYFAMAFSLGVELANIVRTRRLTSEQEATF